MTTIDPEGPTPVYGTPAAPDWQPLAGVRFLYGRLFVTVGDEEHMVFPGEAPLTIDGASATVFGVLRWWDGVRDTGGAAARLTLADDGVSVTAADFGTMPA